MKHHTLAWALAASLASSLASATVVTVNDAAYAASSYVSPAPTGVETHIIGVYETNSDHSGNYHPGGTAYVHIVGQSDAPINLVLSSYEPTTWVLDGDGVGNIGQLVLNGYHASTATGIDAGVVLNKTGIGNYFSACARAWPNSEGGCDTPGLVAGLKTIIPTEVTSFSGAYRATDFTVNLSAVPEAGTLSMLLLGLPAVAAIRRRQHRQAD